jgi:hypothetical protein
LHSCSAIAQFCQAAPENTITAHIG